MKLHPSITHKRLMAAIEESMFGTSNIGFCIHCGAKTHGVEPDAEKYRCEECGKQAVYGAEQILLIA